MVRRAVVSPGGVGFDINCGVRLLRTNLSEGDVAPFKEELAQGLFDHIPVGVGSQGVIPTTSSDLQASRTAAVAALAVVTGHSGRAVQPQ